MRKGKINESLNGGREGTAVRVRVDVHSSPVSGTINGFLCANLRSQISPTSPAIPQLLENRVLGPYDPQVSHVPGGTGICMAGTKQSPILLLSLLLSLTRTLYVPTVRIVIINDCCVYSSC